MSHNKRYLLSTFILMSLIVGAIVQAQEYRPGTGTFIKDMQRNGLGELTIINDDSRRDALAVLADLNKEPFIKVFIRAGESFKISGIDDGLYNMYFKLGNKWNQVDSKFLEDEIRYKLDRSLEFKTEETPDGILYSTWTVALKEAVSDANEAVGKVPVSEEEFPS